MLPERISCKVRINKKNIFERQRQIKWQKTCPLLAASAKQNCSLFVLPELLIGGTEIFVDGIQVGVVSQKHFVGGSVLQHLGDRSQVSALLGGQLTPCRHLDDVEGIRRHNGWVHVAVIEKVPHNLEGKKSFGLGFTLYEPPYETANVLENLSSLDNWLSSVFIIQRTASSPLVESLTNVVSLKLVLELVSTKHWNCSFER